MQTVSSSAFVSRISYYESKRATMTRKSMQMHIKIRSDFDVKFTLEKKSSCLNWQFCGQIRIF